MLHYETALLRSLREKITSLQAHPKKNNLSTVTKCIYPVILNGVASQGGTYSYTRIYEYVRPLPTIREFNKYKGDGSIERHQQ